MNKSLIIIFCFVGLILSNCSSEINETEISIQYELLDNVSPLNAVLLVNEELSWSEWIINDTIRLMSEDKSKLEYWFNESGTSNIKLDARGKNGEEYFGNLNIEIPQIANKLILTGYKFESDYDFNITDENLLFQFNYYNGSEYTNHSTLISKPTFESNDSVLFDQPIVIDITDFDMINENNLYVYFIIKGEETPKTYFKNNFFLKEWYYHDRTYSPDYIYTDNFISMNKERIYLIADWTR